MNNATIYLYSVMPAHEGIHGDDDGFMAACDADVTISFRVSVLIKRLDALNRFTPRGAVMPGDARHHKQAAMLQMGRLRAPEAGDRL